MSRVRDLASILTASSNMATDAEVTSAISAQFIAGKNKIINGDFGIWQRGTSFTNPTDNTYVCDRFKQNGNGSGFTKIWSRETFTPGAAPVSGYESPYFFRFNQTVAGTGGTNNNIGIYVHEDVRTFAGQIVTLSFWAKADSLRSLFLYYGQEFNNSSVGDQYPYISTASLTTTWARYSFTFTVASISGKTIGSGFTGNFQIVFNANNNITQTIDLWGVQLEAGSTATNFQTATGNPVSELAACQRYYSTSIPTGFTITNFSGMNQGSSSAVAWCSPGSSNDAFTNIQYPVPMRSAPTFNIYSAGNRTSGSMRDNVTGSDITVSNYSIQAGNNKGFNYMSGMSATTGRPYGFQWTASAEL